jgi:predicted O-linked N-acetylglucosamine transferase (SPINDLY family)
MKNKRGKPPSPTQVPVAPSAPNAIDRLLSQALAHHAAGRLAEAEALCRQVLAASPNHSVALHLLGIIAYQVGQNPLALELIEAALQANPQSAEAHNNRGSVLHSLRRYQEAVAARDRALLLNPNFPDAWHNRGNALFALDQHQAALEAYDRAIALDPNHAEAHRNRGSALYSLLQFEAALASYDRALAIRPDFAGAHANRGYALLALKQYEPALASFNRALALQPNHEYLRGTRLYTMCLLCDWHNADDDLAQLQAAIPRGERAALPFATVALSDWPAVQRRAAEIYVADKHPPRPGAAPILPRAPQLSHRRIRIGYFSADFHTHAICNLMVELFERSDHARFELFAFSFGPTHDQMTKRVAAAMDQFLDVRSLSDAEIAQRSRELEIDIAVDLMGFTLHCRTGIFTRRAAPIQVNYLGFPGTMGADFIDYLIADATLIPESSRQYYSEKIVYLPDTFQATDSTLAPDTIPCTRAGEGLPETGFVFCCFNNSAKIGPAVFDLWMRILDRVPGSVLWLLEDNPSAAENLRQQALLRGIDPGRLVFAKHVPMAQHLSRQRLAGLFLDTFPFNAGATASPALWAGLPVLTCMGQTFAGRMAASLLQAISLPESSLAELITTSEQEYQALAIELALDPERLRPLRERLESNRRTTPLFDTAAFTRHLEAAYAAMYGRLQSNLPPDHIHIARTAEALGLERSHLYRKMKALGVNVKES